MNEYLIGVVWAWVAVWFFMGRDAGIIFAVCFMLGKFLKWW
jgi:hypothetical protein